MKNNKRLLVEKIYDRFAEVNDDYLELIEAENALLTDDHMKLIRIVLEEEILEL